MSRWPFKVRNSSPSPSGCDGDCVGFLVCRDFIRPAKRPRSPDSVQGVLGRRLARAFFSYYYKWTKQKAAELIRGADKIEKALNSSVRPEPTAQAPAPKEELTKEIETLIDTLVYENNTDRARGPSYTSGKKIKISKEVRSFFVELAVKCLRIDVGELPDRWQQDVRHNKLRHEQKLRNERLLKLPIFKNVDGSMNMTGIKMETILRKYIRVSVESALEDDKTTVQPVYVLDGIINDVNGLQELTSDLRVTHKLVELVNKSKMGVATLKKLVKYHKRVDEQYVPDFKGLLKQSTAKIHESVWSVM